MGLDGIDCGVKRGTSARDRSRELKRNEGQNVSKLTALNRDGEEGLRGELLDGVVGGIGDPGREEALHLLETVGAKGSE